MIDTGKVSLTILVMRAYPHSIQDQELNSFTTYQ